MVDKKLLLVLADSGFNSESVSAVADRVLAFRDAVNDRMGYNGGDSSFQDKLSRFADDPLNHGSIVLTKLAELVPQAKFVLIRAISGDDRIIRAQRAANGSVIREGWSEAVVWAVELAADAQMNSVVNCSFGGFPDSDTVLFECMQLAQVFNPRRRGHILVAATGKPSQTDCLPSPAAFPAALSVGLQAVSYSNRQSLPGGKPDILLAGDGPVSFRTAEVTAAVAHLLMRSPGGLTVSDVRGLLGKYPDIGSLIAG